MNEFLKKHPLGAAYFHKDCTLVMEGTKIRYPEHSVAVLPWNGIDKRNAQSMIDQRSLTVYSLDSFFTPYRHGEKAITLFTHIAGGIGDMIAFSAIPAYLNRYMIRVHTELRFFPIFQWFTHPVITLGWSDTIVKDYTNGNRLTKYSLLRRLPLEYSAIESHDRNWYEGFFDRIGVSDPGDEYKRPHLKTYRIHDEPTRLKKGAVLICHRASCQMRSSTLEDFFVPIRQIYPNRPLYVNQIDLEGNDAAFAEKNNIHVLSKASISQFLLDLFDAAMVVTTDSSAIHFREGIEKPCLGVFGATTTQSRTQYYLHTRSFNTRSDCAHQPCFIHELKKNMVCKNADEGDRVARCQTGISFQEQLYEQLKNYTI